MPCLIKMTGGTHPKGITKKYGEEQLQNALTAVKVRYNNVFYVHLLRTQNAIPTS